MGAEVTLTEVTPDPIQGLEWGEPQFSPATLVIAADQTVDVLLTNTATLPPTEETSTAISPETATRILEPTGTATGTAGPALASTGADNSGTALIGAPALMGVGALLLMLRRRRALR